MTAMILSADRLFDGSGTTLVKPVVRVEGEHLASVERSLLPPQACSGERYDFSGCTLLPGLIDTHVHLVFAALESHEAVIAQLLASTNEDLVQQALLRARAALEAGLTTVRDCGGRGRVIQEVRDRIRRGEAEGADILACGAPITTPTGHCHWLGLTAQGADEAEAAAQRMLDEGADFLKVMATGGNMTASSDPLQAQFDDAALARIAAVGHRAGRHAAAHVMSRVALPGVIAAGYRTIEHCDWRIEENRYEFDPEIARHIREGGQYVGLTMAGIARRAFLPQVAALDSPILRRLGARFEAEKRTIEAGVSFTLHSDAGVRLTPINRFDLGLRAAVLELGLTPSEALRAATGTAAAALGLTDRGILEVGRRADLVVVEGNPLTDLECLSKIRAVMKAGRWVHGAPRPLPTPPNGASSSARME